MTRVSSVTKTITPAESCYLGGYAMRAERSQGVMDELKCTALVLECGGESVVFCDAEILLINAAISTAVKARLADAFGLKPEFVTIAAIHTHAAPELRAASSRLACGDAEQAERYEAFLTARIYETIAEALRAERHEAAASFRTVRVEGFYGNRNGAGKPEDKDVSVVLFRDASVAVRAGVVNIACHPTVLGADNLLISGDLLGYLSDAFFARYGVYPVMMQGAAGDMSNRNYRKGHDRAELIRTGDGIAAQVFADGAFEALTLAEPSSEAYDWHCAYKLDVASWRDLRETTRAAMEAEGDYDKRKILHSSLVGIDAKLAQTEIRADFHASILRLGDVTICRQPGEMFSRFGMRIKAASPAKLPLIWGYADDYFGYMADAGEYGKTYESMMSPLPKGAAEEISAALAAMMAAR